MSIESVDGYHGDDVPQALRRDNIDMLAIDCDAAPFVFVAAEKQVEEGCLATSGTPYYCRDKSSLPLNSDFVSTLSGQGTRTIRAQKKCTKSWP